MISSKPFEDELLLESIKRALDQGKESRSQNCLAQTAAARIALSTDRERRVFERLAIAEAKKEIPNLVLSMCGNAKAAAERRRA